MKDFIFLHLNELFLLLSIVDITSFSIDYCYMSKKRKTVSIIVERICLQFFSIFITYYLTLWFDINDVIIALKISTIAKQFLIEILTAFQALLWPHALYIALRETRTYKEILGSKVKILFQVLFKFGEYLIL